MVSHAHLAHCDENSGPGKLSTDFLMVATAAACDGLSESLLSPMEIFLWRNGVFVNEEPAALCLLGPFVSCQLKPVQGCSSLHRLARG